VLTASKTSPDNARSVAAALVAAEADGQAGHGVSRLSYYADQALSGKVDGLAVPRVEETAAAAVCVDARDGFAYPAIDLGFDRILPMVEKTGIAALGISGSHHFGMAGTHVESLAEHGLLALAFSNSPAAIAPWGGSRALFGTNPVAMACPRAEGAPLVIDLSLSKVARGKINVAAAKGEPIPEGWALDKEGRPTTDAAAAMAGTMLPAGGIKGALLVLMVEILAAALTGSNFGYEASSFFDADGPPPRIGQLFIVVRPECLSGNSFTGRVEELLGAITEQPGARLPGMSRLHAREQARKLGVEVADTLLADLHRRAGDGVDG
jgi:(2R)-3-sulfolactate dehydrogenase (NADP+)